eukprot:797824-Rhodomonas_salina.2
MQADPYAPTDTTVPLLHFEDRDPTVFCKAVDAQRALGARHAPHQRRVGNVLRAGLMVNSPPCCLKLRREKQHYLAPAVWTKRSSTAPLFREPLTHQPSNQ